MAEYRHELKYYITYNDYMMLKQRMSAVMNRDKNTNENGEYFIRSLYFDDIDDFAFREKLDGVDERDKFRLRTYNYSQDVAKLERKHKQNGYILKDSITLSRNECDMFLNGQYNFLLERNEKFSKELFRIFTQRIFKPRVIVDYMREPYVFPLGDVRVTFDKDIRTAYRSTDIFDSKIPTYPVITEGAVVLEVKFNDILPSFIHSVLQIDSPLRSAVSKYCICRKFEL